MDRLRETGNACQEKGLPIEKIFVIPGDVTKKAQVDAIVENSASHYGRLDVVIHAAGGTKLKNIFNCSIEDLDWTYDITIRSAFMITKASIPHLQKTKGSIVHVSAAAGLRPYSFSIPFTVTSSGYDHFIKAVCIDLGKKGIRITSLNPATTNSSFFINALLASQGREPSPQEIIQHADLCARSFPSSKIGTVEEAANILLFLASPGANFMTGVQLPFDGGYTNTSYIPK